MSNNQRYACIIKSKELTTNELLSNFFVNQTVRILIYALRERRARNVVLQLFLHPTEIHS